MVYPMKDRTVANYHVIIIVCQHGWSYER